MTSAEQAGLPAIRVSGQSFDADSVATAVVINFLTLAMPLALLQVFDRVIPHQSYDTLLGIFVVMIGVLAVDFVLKAARAQFVLAAARQRGGAIGQDLARALFDGTPAVLERLGREATAERLMGVLGLRQTVHEQTTKVTVDLAFSCLFLLIIAGLGGWLVLAPLSVMLGLLIVAARLRPGYREASRLRREYDRRRLSFLSEVLQQARLVKLLGVEHQMLRRYELLQASASGASETLIRLGGGGTGAAGMGTQIATMLTCAVGGLLAIETGFTVAELAACMLLTGRAVQPVIQLTFLSAARDDADARESGLAEVTAALAKRPLPAPAPVTGGLSVTGLGLRREGGDGFHFRNVSFAARPGQLVAIDGPLACRCGSLLRMLAGELQPDEGTIVLDGPGRLDAASPGSPPGLILEPREPVILDGQILDNLAAFSSTSPGSDLRRAAITLGLSGQIAQFPAGLQSALQDDRSGLGSPGFYRRLALARAIGRRPQILLLEDPFADLDPAGRSGLSDLLLSLQGDVTCILTRPDPAIAEAADCTVLLRPAPALRR